jgi:hypothetical protein
MENETVGKILDWLLNPNNRKACQIVGIFLTAVPLVFFFQEDSLKARMGTG